jgi:hypothetical protein
MPLSYEDNAKGLRSCCAVRNFLYHTPSLKHLQIFNHTHCVKLKGQGHENRK